MDKPATLNKPMPGTETVLIIAVVMLVFAAIAALALRLLDPSSSTVDRGAWNAYEACESLLTEGELSFFRVLDQALAGEYRLFAKVRLADVVRPVQGPSRSGRQAAFNRISAKHVDFVLCDPASMRVVGVIELDDKSHRGLERGLRDTIVDAALAGAGIPIIRFAARQAYSPIQLRDEVRRTVR